MLKKTIHTHMHISDILLIYDLNDYEKDLEEVIHMTKEEYLAPLRR